MGFKTRKDGRRFKVLQKNVFTKGKFVEVDSNLTLSMADAKAEFLRKQKFIMGKDSFGAQRPNPKTQTKIVEMKM